MLSVQAAILLGQFLHLVSSLVPHEVSNQPQSIFGNLYVGKGKHFYYLEGMVKEKCNRILVKPKSKSLVQNLSPKSQIQSLKSKGKGLDTRFIEVSYNGDAISGVQHPALSAPASQLCGHQSAPLHQEQEHQGPGRRHRPAQAPLCEEDGP